MRILHVNYYDILGGAAKAAYRLHHELLQTGQDSMMLVADKKSDDQSVIPAFSSKQLFFIKMKQRLEKLLTYSCRKKHLFPHSLNIFHSGLISQINSLKPDIVNLHWINGCMLSIKGIKTIQAPIIWTLHDGWAYCGAEHHHQYDDKRYKSGYDQSSLLDINRYIWKQKMQYWKDLNLNIVAPSNWLGQEAAESCIMHDNNIQTIHNGIDLNTFSPKNTKNKDNGKKIIAFGAFNINDWNKGGKELLNALRILREKYKQEFELLLIGNGRFPDEFKSQNTGFIISDKEIAKIYPQADVFVLASKYDNLPNMLVEASACGIPVVGFNTGGIPDVIQNKFNGYLAKAFDPEDLAYGLNYILSNKDNKMMINARKLAEDKFDIKKISVQYTEYYEKILAQNGAK
jgi:glycosyltransferase involved in cell wall biosynthesis